MNEVAKKVGATSNANGTIYLPPGSGDWADTVDLVGEIFHLAGSKAPYYDKELAIAVRKIPEFAKKNPLTPKSAVFDPAYKGKPEDPGTVDTVATSTISNEYFVRSPNDETRIACQNHTSVAGLVVNPQCTC